MKYLRCVTAAMLVAAIVLPTPPAIAAAPAAVATDDARLTAFLDAEYAEWLKRNPELSTGQGFQEGGDRWDDRSDAAAIENVEWRRASVARMKAMFDRARLSPEAQVNFDIWADAADRAALSLKGRRHRPPFYSRLDSLHAALPNFLVNGHSVSDVTDLTNYIARLRGLPTVLDAAIERSKASSAGGIRAPKFQLESVINGSQKLTSGAPFETGPDAALWADVQAKTAKLVADGKLPKAQADALLADARAAILALKPVYDRVIAWAVAELPTAPSGRVGAITLPGGAAYYADELKLATTTDLTAEQIHAIGLKEVTRIEAEQDVLAQRSGFANRQAFYAYRANRYPPRPFDDAARAEYLKEANDFVAKTRALLPGYFNTLPAYRIEIVREPGFTEVAGGAAHASRPSADGVRPARAYVHLVGMTPDPAALYTLMCHESVPGHNTQGDIQVRQTSGPKFRSTTSFVAFSEGWALYAEKLCAEMGAFPTIAADFMRLDAELFRAARLVVDTGIHALGWTEDEAVRYMIETGRQPPQRSASEVRRYITRPAQATGYKIGMLKIMEQREKAQKALGPKFDLKAFHDLLIASGAQPMSILERRVDGWIASQKG